MNCVFVYNPNSGKGKIQKKIGLISDALGDKFDDVVIVSTERPGHAKEIAQDSCGKFDYLIIAGGDGSLNEAINGIAGRENRPIIGYIPCGTVNDVAHSLKISRNIKKALKTICEGVEFKHDIFKLNDRYGIYVCCMGVFTETSYSTEQFSKKRFGKIAYALHALKKTFNTESINLKLTYKNKIIDGKYAFVVALNSRYVAGFPANKHGNFHDGEIDLILVKNPDKEKISLAGIIRTMKIFVFGMACDKMDRKIKHIKVDKFSFSSNSIVNIDGEKMDKADNYDFSVIKEGITIMVPQKVVRYLNKKC